MRHARFGSLTLLAALAMAGPSAAQPDPCGAVAAELRRLDASGTKLAPSLLNLFALSRRKGSVVRLDDSDADGFDRKELPARLKQIGASPELARRAGELVESDGYVRSAGPVGMFQTIQGSAACSSFLFFARTKNGARPIAAPPVAEASGEDMSFCHDDDGWLAQVAGQPAFVREMGSEENFKSEVSIAPWRAGRWARACNLTIDYSSVFRLGEVHCRLGAACRALETKAVALASRRNLAPSAKRFAPEPLRAVDAARIKRMTALAAAADEESVDLPTFGEKGEAAYTGFRGSALFPISLGGKTYLARLGLGSIGWRTWWDYNLAVYDLAGGKLQPVAGVVVKRERGRLMLRRRT